MADSLRESVIPEGRIGRAEVEAKLHLTYLSDVTPEYLASLSHDQFHAATADVIALFSAALQRIQATHHRWLMYGFNCGMGPASGHHRKANLATQLRREAGVRFRGSGLSSDASDIAAEQARAFLEGERKRAYEANFSAAWTSAQAAFRHLLEEVDQLRNEWRVDEDGNTGPSTSVISRLATLLSEAQDLHDRLVDIILHFLPGRTFLKS